MKIMRAIILVIGLSLLVNLQSGCFKSKEKTKTTTTIQSTPDKNDVDNTQNQPPEDPTKVPVIHVENATFDIGSVGPNKRIPCEYVVKNIGTGDLHLNKLLTPCQCTEGKIEKTPLAPGESGKIFVTYTSPSYEVAVQKHLHVLSNDKKNPRFEFTIKGKVEYHVQPSPKPIKLFLNQENAGADKITLKSKDGKPFSIASFTSSGDVMTMDFDPAVKKTEFALDVKVDKEKLRKTLNGTVKIRLTHPETNQVNLTYSSLPLYVVSPPRFVLRDLQPGKSIERELWVKSNYLEKVEIESIDSTNGYMEVNKQESQGNSVKLFVKITPPAQEGKTRRYLSDKLTIKLTDGETLTVTLSGWYAIKTAK